MKKLLYLSLLLIAFSCGDQDLRTTNQAIGMREDFPEGRVQTCAGQGVYVWNDSRIHSNYPSINPSVYYYDVFPQGNPVNGCVGVAYGTVNFHIRNSGAYPFTVIFNNSKATTKTVQPNTTHDFSMAMPSGIQPGMPAPQDKVRLIYKIIPQCTSGVFAHQMTWDISGTYLPQQYYWNPNIYPSGGYQNVFGWGATWGNFTCP